MEFRVLRYFLAVAREENISHAAEYLHVTQPALSKQIKNLENEVGKKLFVRGNYSMKLTDEGRLLKKRAEEIVAMIDKTMNEFQSMNELTGGEIYIGSAESDALRYFFQAARNLQKQYPDTCFHLYSGNTETVCERLDKGLLDFGIVAQEIDQTKYNTIQIPCPDRWGLLMKKESPLAKQETISLAELTKLPLIVSRQAMRTDFPKWLGETIDQMHIIATYDLIYNASIMVKENLGYALSFDKLISFGEESELCFRPIEPVIETPIYIIWKKYQEFTPLALVLLEELRKVCQKL